MNSFQGFQQCICTLLLMLALPTSFASEVTAKGFVNIYPVQGAPVRAKANEAIVTLYPSGTVPALGSDTILTGDAGEFEWRTTLTMPILVSLEARVLDFPGQYRLKNSHSFKVEAKNVDLREIRLFDIRRAAQELFAEVQKTITAMRAEHKCLRPGKTHQAIWSCWSANSEDLTRARSKVEEALSRLQDITNHPQQVGVVRERLALMTGAAMFCAQSDFGSDQDWIQQRENMVQEQAESLMYCARGLGLDPTPLTFPEVRTFLRANVDQVSKPVKRRLLSLWLDSYFRQAQETELVKVAAWINTTGLFDEWRGLTDQASQQVSEFPSFSENVATAAQIAAVRQALAFQR
jgi:hypothetical protein